MACGAAGLFWEVPLRGSGVVTGRSRDWGSGSSWVLGGSSGSRWFQVLGQFRLQSTQSTASLR